MHLSLSYLKFLVCATNQHGVHSPFVYAFVSKCVYSKKKYSPKKSINLFLKMVAYFNSTTVHISEENEALENQIQEQFVNVKISNTSANLWYVARLNKSTLQKISTSHDFHNNSILFINDIYKNKRIWEELIQQQKIKVSINMFYCGIVFFRKEQEKQHFKIRI